MMQRFAFILVLSLALLQCAAAESNLRASTSNHAASSQRRELSWWGNLANLLHPRHNGSGGNGGGGSSSSYSGSGSDSSYSDSASASSYYSDGSGSVSAATSSGSGSGSGGDGSGVEQSNYLENGDGNGSMSTTGIETAAPWLFIAVALVAAAVGTAFMVNRKKLQQRSAAESLSGKQTTKGPAVFVEIASVPTGSYTAPQEV